MRHRILIFVLITCATVISAQEIIRGTYSYTYGDNESLVQAKQTCKNLAVRDAIESYYIFVESTTKVENAQTKEDLIQSISSGIVQNLKIIDQKEDGKTITTNVEGTVNPEQVKQLVNQKISAQVAVSSDTAGKSKPATQASAGNTNTRFNAAISKYENRMSSIQLAWNNRQYDSAINQIQDIQKWLSTEPPIGQGGFNGLLYQSLQTRNELLMDLIKLDKSDYSKRKVREKAAIKVIMIKSGKLEKEIKDLDKITNLSQKQKTIRNWWSALCRLTVARAKSAIKH